MANANIKKVKAADLELKERMVAVNRVVKVTKGGRIFSFAAIMVVGNENGIVGYGLGKAKEVSTAIAKGTEDAKKNLIQVPVLKGTIPHAQEGKYSGAAVLVIFFLAPLSFSYFRHNLIYCLTIQNFAESIRERVACTVGQHC